MIFLNYFILHKTYFILPISNREAMGQIIDRGHSRIPVYDENPKNLIGLLLVCIFPYFDFIYIISFLLGSFILTCVFYLFITRSKTFSGYDLKRRPLSVMYVPRAFHGVFE